MVCQAQPYKRCAQNSETRSQESEIRGEAETDLLASDF